MISIRIDRKRRRVKIVDVEYQFTTFNNHALCSDGNRIVLVPSFSMYEAVYRRGMSYIIINVETCTPHMLNIENMEMKNMSNMELLEALTAAAREILNIRYNYLKMRVEFRSEVCIYRLCRDIDMCTLLLDRLHCRYLGYRDWLHITELPAIVMTRNSLIYVSEVDYHAVPMNNQTYMLGIYNVECTDKYMFNNMYVLHGVEMSHGNVAVRYVHSRNRTVMRIRGCETYIIEKLRNNIRIMSRTRGEAVLVLKEPVNVKDIINITCSQPPTKLDQL